MYKLFFFLAIVAGCILSSCDTKVGSGANSTGKGSEILIVCDKMVWDGPAGNAIRLALTREMAGLPESEAEYTLINVPYAKFSNFLRTHRNVLIIELKPDQKEGVETQVNTWSHPQRVIRISAANTDSFVELFRKQEELVRALFDKNERARFAAQNALSRNQKVETTLEQDFGIKMIVSKDFYQAKKNQDFIWLRSETNEMSLGLMIYTRPYSDTNQMGMKSIVALRNHYTMENIPGPAEGSYMVVSDKVILPVARRINFNRQFAVETRGLWETHGDFMGGPFINYSVVDTLRQRIVTMDGYVYLPNRSKRNYIRQLESIIWGAEFVSPQPPKEKK